MVRWRNRSSRMDVHETGVPCRMPSASRLPRATALAPGMSTMARWVVTLHSPEEETSYGRTFEKALVWCLVWLMVPEIDLEPFRTELPQCLAISVGVSTLAPRHLRRLPLHRWQRDVQPQPCPVIGAQIDVAGKTEGNGGWAVVLAQPLESGLRGPPKGSHAFLGSGSVCALRWLWSTCTGMKTPRLTGHWEPITRCDERQ